MARSPDQDEAAFRGLLRRTVVLPLVLLALLSTGFTIQVLVLRELPILTVEDQGDTLERLATFACAAEGDGPPASFRPGESWIGQVALEAAGRCGPIDEPVNFSLPSIDVLFESAAAVYGARVAGVVLSGANEDGAAGLRAICDAGGVGMIQAVAEASAPTMPRAAKARCPGATELSLAEIARTLQRLDGTRPG